MKELKSIYTRVGKPDMSKGGTHSWTRLEESEDTIAEALEFADWQNGRWMRFEQTFSP